MTRKTFLTIVACVATAIGCFALTAPGVLIAEVKSATSNGAAEVMGRTVGILLLSFGVLNFLVRSDPDSPTMRSVLRANLVLQLGIMPIDPSAYFTGVYGAMDSFVPNTVLHVVLAFGFIHFLRKMDAA